MSESFRLPALWTPLEAPKGASVAGISGGRTSGLMAFLLHPSTILTFQNTGKEHEKTLEFLLRLEDDLSRPIVRLEWRPPPNAGPPREAGFEVVTHQTMARRGEPFLELLRALRTYRQTKDLGPVVPWPRSRICTAYLKIKTQQRYMQSLGHGDGYTSYVGLRADEPERVFRLRDRASARGVDDECPLYDQGITKADVLQFWRSKPYDLEIPEHLGNCDACFMKDERDLATALLDPGTDAAWWINIESEFGPMRRGRSSYAEVFAEAPARMEIRRALVEGREPVSQLSAKRHLTIVKQEREPVTRAWSCSCEGASDLADNPELLG